MRKTIHFISVVVLITSGMFFITSCKDDDDTTVIPTLTAEEKSDLLFLREEEKLARDVYLYAYDQYGLKISKNISVSEQTHVDEVLKILTAYNLDDPASHDRGVFKNQELQNLYNSLTTLADSSMQDALIVGATIEDLDISDLDDFTMRTDKADLLSMYNKLVCGSRNHLRAYYSQITDNGGIYTPQFISQDEFETIVNSDKEQCNN